MTITDATGKHSASCDGVSPDAHPDANIGDRVIRHGTRREANGGKVKYVPVKSEYEVVGSCRATEDQRTRITHVACRQWDDGEPRKGIAFITPATWKRYRQEAAPA